MIKYLSLIGLIIPMFYISCGTQQYAPVITGITFDPTEVYVGEDVTCTVDATDENNDVLTFDWSVEAGTLLVETGDTVIWTVPDSSGTYTITVVATDEVDLTAEFSEDLVVLSGWPNYISGEKADSLLMNYNTWIYSVITISGAPATAEVESLTVTLDIDHNRPIDLLINLIAPDSAVITLWNHDYPGGIQSITTADLAGTEVNGDWEIGILDDQQGQQGTFNNWSIGIWFGLQ